MHAHTIPDLTLPQMLRERAQAHPDRIALHQKDFGIWQPLTWQTYYQRAGWFGLGLVSLGLQPGDHVGILSENRTEWVLAQMGCGLVGAITVGVYATSPWPEVAYVVNHADVEIVVCEDQEQVDKIAEAIGQLPRLRRVIVIEPDGFRNTDPRIAAITLLYDDVEARGREYERQHTGFIASVLEAQSMEDIGLMIYTSGSTGKPKGAMISYRNIHGVSPGIIAHLELTPASSHLSYLPLCHVAEQMLTTFVPIYLGSQVNFGESIRTVQEDLREIAPNLFLGVPRIWEKLHSSIMIKIAETGRIRRWLFHRALAATESLSYVRRADRTLAQRLTYAFWYWIILRALQNFTGLRRCRVALTGAAPIPPAVVRFFRNIGVPLVEVYGLTESTGMVTGQPLSNPQPTSVGTAILNADCRIDPATSELLVRGPMVFAGYYKNEAATHETIHDGWLHTGDLATERNGQIYIVDRMKDIMITAGGKNITPSEIENVMKGSPYIKECIVIADGRRFVSALIQIDFETVGKWAESHGIAFTHFRSLATHEQVHALVQAEIDAGNATLAPVANIRRFHLLTKELDHDDGEVTATMKVRRASIYDAYASEIETLYA
ncbi:long-chain fatty acid--CoA ligase [Castellaniella sp.]|uniref:AMP-dependent synthetase/ligase n=1 Tax=Castellaniella sp. TaxID=1955812 RepID=UPI0035606E46